MMMMMMNVERSLIAPIAYFEVKVRSPTLCTPRFMAIDSGFFLQSVVEFLSFPIGLGLGHTTKRISLYCLQQVWATAQPVLYCYKLTRQYFNAHRLPETDDGVAYKYRPKACQPCRQRAVGCRIALSVTSLL